jgi:hypothetical protein
MQPLERHWKILNLIPPHGKGITRLQIQQRLFGDGQHINDDPALTRQLQRDMVLLKELLGNKLEVIQEIDEDGNKLGYPKYSWCENGPPVFLGSMSLNETLAFGVLKQIGVKWMPKVLQQALEPFFKDALDEANQLLINRGQSRRKSTLQTNRWLKKIYYSPSGMVFEAPPIKDEVEIIVHEALLNESCLEIEYRNSSGKKSTVTISPQILLQRGERTYLLAKNHRFEDVGTFFMPRISFAKMVLGDFQRVSEDKLQEALKKGTATPTFPNDVYGQVINLKIWVNSGTLNWLKETPLSSDQTTSEESEGGGIVKASVTLKEELIWWLRSMGPHIRVLEPPLIFERIERELKEALERYQSFKA